MHYRWVLSSQILALTCLAAQASQIQNNGRQIEPCAQVSDWIAQAKTTKGIPGNLAYGCLTSMPFDAKDAVRFIDEYRKYLQFQSTIENLKSMCLLSLQTDVADFGRSPRPIFDAIDRFTGWSGQCQEKGSGPRLLQPLGFRIRSATTHQFGT